MDPLRLIARSFGTIDMKLSLAWNGQNPVSYIVKLYFAIKRVFDILDKVAPSISQLGNFFTQYLSFISISLIGINIEQPTKEASRVNSEHIFIRNPYQRRNTKPFETHCDAKTNLAYVLGYTIIDCFIISCRQTCHCDISTTMRPQSILNEFSPLFPNSINQLVITRGIYLTDSTPRHPFDYDYPKHK